MKRSTRFGLIVRRAHLWSGLFLVPWVLLYGVTAMLFNHGTWFSESTRRDFDALPGSPLPPADRLAEEVLQAWLEEAAAGEGGLAAAEARECESSEPVPSKVIDRSAPWGILDAGYEGSVVGAAESEGLAHTLVLDLERERASLRSRPIEGKADASEEAVSGEVDWSQVLQGRVEAELDRLGLDPGGSARLRRAPSLLFDARIDERRQRFRFDLLRSRLHISEPGEAEGPGWRRYLLRLHTAHGVPDQKNVRWVWAVIVDVMAVAMVFWGLSGMFLWTQMPRLRRLGAWVLVTSLLLGVAMGLAMFRDMLS